MFRGWTCSLLASHSGQLASVAFWRRRPQSLHAHSGPQMVSRNYWRSAKRRRLDPDDPTVTIPLSRVYLVRCPNCKRVKTVMPEYRSHFHACCEIFEMEPCRSFHPVKNTVKKAMHFHHTLTAQVRQWDFARGRPKSNVHKPHNGAHSKLPKK